jgi:hypothetical protein
VRSTKTEAHFKPLLPPHERPLVYIVRTAAKGWLFTRTVSRKIRFYRVSGWRGSFACLTELHKKSIKGLDLYIYELYEDLAAEIVSGGSRQAMTVKIHTGKGHG